MTIINQLFPGSISGLFKLRHKLSMRLKQIADLWFLETVINLNVVGTNFQEVVSGSDQPDIKESDSVVFFWWKINQK